MEARESLNQDQDGLEGQVLEGLEEPAIEANASESGKTESDPLYIQKRLKRQERAHERETHELRSMVAELQSRMSEQTNNMQPSNNPYSGSQEPGMDEHIHRAVSFALNHRDMKERQAKEAEAAMHVQKKYEQLHKHLDNVADKYEDFDDVVRSDSASFTPHMRDASLLLPKSGPGSAGEVLYKLGKNPSELKRIAALHPVDQASELVNLSHALNKGQETEGNSQSRHLGQIKNNPVTNSKDITVNTPISEIRARMKSGKFR